MESEDNQENTTVEIESSENSENEIRVRPPTPIQPESGENFQVENLEVTHLDANFRKLSTNTITPIEFQVHQSSSRMETKDKIKCGALVIIPILILSVALMTSSFHVIQEGHVGIYFKQGALQVKLKPF